MLGTACGTEEQLMSLYTSRLEFFLNQIIDTTVRGFVYEPPGGSASAEVIEAGLDVARSVTSRNSIPLLLLNTGPEQTEQWLSEAHAAIDSVLS
jgi:hypothetical protein